MLDVVKIKARGQGTFDCDLASPLLNTTAFIVGGIDRVIMFVSH